jgi:hypothetical protein
MALYNVLEDPKKKEAKKASEKVLIKRLLDKPLRNSGNKKAIEVINRVAQKTGLRPSFIAANAMQEGMNLAIQDDGNMELDEAFADNLPVDKNWEDYPVNGYLYYGLDTFGDSVQHLKEKGYLDKDFDFAPFETKNEKGQRVRTGAFKSHEDALLAKAAYLKEFRDQVRDYSSKNKLKLDPKTEDYLTMSAYNGGFGNAKMMIDELTGGKFNQSDYVSKGLTSRKGVHKNVAPRMEKIDWISQMYEGPRPSVPVPMPVAGKLSDILYKPPF